MKSLTGVESDERNMIFSAPELFGKSVTTASDSWSIGCLLLYLFQTKEERQNPIFTGKDTKSVLGSMKKVFGVLSPEFISKVATSYKIVELKATFVKCLSTTPNSKETVIEASEEDTPNVIEQAEKVLSRYCTRAPKEALNLIASFLRFSPRERISCTKALKHPFFLKCRRGEFSSGNEETIQKMKEKSQELSSPVQKGQNDKNGSSSQGAFLSLKKSEGSSVSNSQSSSASIKEKGQPSMGTLATTPSSIGISSSSSPSSML